MSAKDVPKDLETSLLGDESGKPVDRATYDAQREALRSKEEIGR